MPRTLRDPKVLVVALALFVVGACAPDSSRQPAPYVVPDTAEKTSGQAQALTEALRQRGLVCSDLYPHAKPLLVRDCSRKDATHDVRADFAATPDGRLSSALLDVSYQSEPGAGSELAAIVEAFGAAGSVGNLTSLLDQKGDYSTSWGKVTVISEKSSIGGRVELNRKNWKWPTLPDAHLTGTAAQITDAAAADGFTCTGGAPGGDLECERGEDRVSAAVGGDGLHTIEISAGSWAAARTLQEHVFGELSDAGDPEPMVTQWFAAGEPAGARAYVSGLQLCQTRYSGLTVFKITMLVPFGSC
ncbi:hypothetical protein ACQHIV_11650 [Kribbella sp. GL6]|uniref:hypothetical protein n=1 Tax=Kribbella sp. GL6 TaxID=3419765 RepID=UPI003CFBD697